MRMYDAQSFVCIYTMPANKLTKESKLLRGDVSGGVIRKAKWNRF